MRPPDAVVLIIGYADIPLCGDTSLLWRVNQHVYRIEMLPLFSLRYGCLRFFFYDFSYILEAVSFSVERESLRGEFV